MSVKKATIILIFLCLSFSSFLLGYLGIRYKIGVNPGSGQLLNRFNQTLNPVEKPKKVLSLTQNPIISFGLRGGATRYVQEDGRVFETDIAGSEPKVLSQSKFSNILGIIWSPNIDSLIYIINRNESNKFILLNLDSGLTKNFDYTVETMAFSPNGNKIVFVSNTENDSSIIIQNVDSSDLKKIANIRIKVSTLAWLDDETIYLRSSGKDASTSFLLTLDGQLTKLLEDKPSFEELWSENRKQLFFTYSASDSNNAGILDMATREESILNFETLANKCAWSSDNQHIYCSVPKDQSGKEDLYKIDAQTKEKRFLMALEPYISVEKIALYELGGYAVVQNLLDHKLYRIYLDNL